MNKTQTNPAKKGIFALASTKLANSGLDALFAKSSPDYAFVSIGDIDIKPQVRHIFDDDENSLADLSESIKAQGILQPVLIRPSGERYELVAGERRIRAAKMAGLGVVPAYIRELTDEEAKDAQFAENIHRLNLSMLEEAEQVQRDLDELGSVGAVLAKHHKSRAWLSKKLQLLKLPEQAGRIIMENISADQELILEVARVERKNKRVAKELVDRLKLGKGAAQANNAREQVKTAKAKIAPVKPIKSRNKAKPLANPSNFRARENKNFQEIEAILDKCYKQLVVKDFQGFEQISASPDVKKRISAYLRLSYDEAIENQINAVKPLISGLKSGKYGTEGKAAFCLSAYLKGISNTRFNVNNILIEIAKNE